MRRVIAEAIPRLQYPYAVARAAAAEATQDAATKKKNEKNEEKKKKQKKQKKKQQKKRVLLPISIQRFEIPILHYFYFESTTRFLQIYF